MCLRPCCYIGALMQPSQISFANFTMRFARSLTPSREAAVVFHGFPAQPPWDPAREKGRDIAERIAQDVGHDTFVMHYAGLGQSGGKFSFPHSVTDSIALVDHLRREYGYRTIHLVGHSWGGLVALNVYQALPENVRGNVVLLSPFVFFPDDALLRQALAAIGGQTTIHYAAGDTIDDAVRDLRAVESSHNPLQVVTQVPALGARTLILQADQDDEVPVEHTRRLVAQFPQPPQYYEVPTDHKFSIDRDRWIDTTVAFLKGAEHALAL